MQFVIAQYPPTTDGILTTAEAPDIATAIKQFEQVFGVTLTATDEETYTDGKRVFKLFYNEQGVEDFGQLIAEFLHADHEAQCTCSNEIDPNCPIHDAPPKAKPPVFRFQLGQVVATPGVLRAIEASQEVSSTFLVRHQSGDWGDVDKHDARANETALKDGSRIFSVYHLKDRTKIYVITEATGDDGRRASTCILLPDEY